MSHLVCVVPGCVHTSPYMTRGQMAGVAARPVHVCVADMQTHRKRLPISPARGQLLKEIWANHCCVVVGETGSGKTTQIPQVRDEGVWL